MAGKPDDPGNLAVENAKLKQALKKAEDSLSQIASWITVPSCAPVTFHECIVGLVQKTIREIAELKKP